MAAVIDRITPELRQWIERQPMYFVATAPLSGDGRVNLSPKGYDTFRVLGDLHVAYLDLTGSGAETVAHLEENGRITVMFCAFEGPPRILRLYGIGRPHLRGTRRHGELAAGFPELPGARAIVEIEVDRVQTSCGYGVPEMQPIGQRTRLLRWAEASESIEGYWMRKNGRSIDGLPSVGTIRTDGSQVDSSG